VDRVGSGVAELRLALEKELGQGRLPDEGLARKTLDAGRTTWGEKLEGMRALRVSGLKSRVHGDLHLGQVLERRGGSAAGRFCVVDFEGEPMRPLGERRQLELPLRDVAGMWRSFAYAGAVAGADGGLVEGCRQDFLAGWCERMRLPEGDWSGLLEGLAWEKAVYEALYELRHRPDWLWIPLSELQKEA
jgi:predicted trehalose synthase